MSARRGEANHAAKITERDVHTIRFMRDFGYTQTAIARQMPVGLAQVNRIVHREKWRHVR